MTRAQDSFYWILVDALRAARPNLGWTPKNPAVKQWKKDARNIADAIGARVSSFDKELFLMECGINTPQPGDRIAMDRHLTLEEMERLGVAGKWAWERE